MKFSNSITENKIMARGITSLLNGWNTKSQIHSMVKYSPEVLEQYLKYLEKGVVAQLHAVFLQRNPTRLQNSTWVAYGNALVVSGSYEEMKKYIDNSHYSNAGALLELYFDSLDRKIESGEIKVDWEKLYDSASSVVAGSLITKKNLNWNERKIINSIFPRIAGALFKEKPEKAKAILHNIEFKGYNQEVRSALYKAFINAGLLDKKVARRIRSEGSEYTAQAVIEYFLGKLHLYDDEDAKHLLTQFTDIRHGYAQQTLAENAPDYMVPFMMAFDNSSARSTLKTRAEKISKAKQAKLAAEKKLAEQGGA